MALTFKQKRERRLSIPKLLALAAVALVLLLGSNAFSATDTTCECLKHCYRYLEVPTAS